MHGEVISNNHSHLQYTVILPREDIMYHSKLTFWIAGIAPEIQAQWAGLTPLPRFTHEFRELKNLSEIPPGRNQIVIIHISSGFRPDEIRKAIGNLGTFILCGEDLSGFSVEDMRYADDWWQMPAPSALWQVRFEKLQQRLKIAKDFWLCDTYLEKTINMLPDLVWFKDREGLHLRVNKAFCKAVNKPKEDIIDKDHFYIWGVRREDYIDKPLDCTLSEEKVFARKKTLSFHEDVMLSGKGLRKFTTWKTPIFDEDGTTILGTAGIGRDMTKEYEYRKMITDMARKDSMTGLANRRYMQEYAQTNCIGNGLTVISLDLDHFKEINDTYGHQTGDAALLMLAELLQRSFADGLCVRMGGDEFLVLLPGKVDPADVETKLQSFMTGLLDYYRLDPALAKLSVSAGIAYSTKTVCSLEALERQSDAALYQAKKDGRGCYRVYDASMPIDSTE